MKVIRKGRGSSEMTFKRYLVGLLLVLLLAPACSTLPEVPPDAVPPLRGFEDLAEEDKIHMLEVKDSAEGFNRGTYRFNYYFDEYLFRPVVRAYEFVLPDYVEDRVSHAVDNISEVTNFANNLLQLRFKDAGITLSRFVINSTVGVAGLWDPAEKWGLKWQGEDFGQTLGSHGVSNGSYLVLPVLGPSNVRDAAGFVTDTTAFTLLGPPAWVNNTTVTVGYNTVASVDRRHRIPFRYRQTGSPFEYELLRTLYTMKREHDVAH